ncbi:hypothetical protein DPSP01_012382 [Paraphaeosphaeria sporulosa]
MQKQAKAESGRDTSTALGMHTARDARIAHAQCGARAFENDVTQLNVEGDNVGGLVAAAARGSSISVHDCPCGIFQKCCRWIAAVTSLRRNTMPPLAPPAGHSAANRCWVAYRCLAGNPSAISSTLHMAHNIDQATRRQVPVDLGARRVIRRDYEHVIF